MKYRACPICYSQETESLHTLSFQLLKGIHLPSHYDIVVCQRCQFIYADTMATQADYDRYYQENNGYETTAHYIDQQKYNDIFQCLRKHLQKTDKILEIGFSNGELLMRLKQDGYDVYGLDPSHACVATAQTHGITAFEGTVTQHTITDTFDVIILSHVMEHILDLETVMRRLKALLRPGGKLYIETPDAEQYTANSVTPFCYFDLEHINHFALYSLTNLVQAHGLTVIASGQKTLPIISYPACWVIAALPDRLWVKNDRCVAAVKSYIDQSLHKIYPEIDELIRTQEAVIIWGAGSFAQRLYMLTNLNQCNVTMMVDNDPQKWGKTFGNQTIMPPSAIESNQRIVIVSIYYSQDIVQQILDLGLNPDVIILADRYTTWEI